MISSDATNQPQSPAAARTTRYTMIFGAVMVVVTLFALIIAFFSSDFRPRGSTAVPASWTQAYNADLTGVNDGKWDETHGCSFTALGLDASASNSSVNATSAAQCVFQPSVNGNVTAAGFYFEARLAPAARTPAFARSVISIGAAADPSASNSSVVHFIIAQDGVYTLCDGACTQTGSAIYLHGGLASWHGNALLGNTVAIKVSPDHTSLTVFVNDQQVATVSPQFGAQPAIAVGTTTDSEAIFTHATLYIGQ
jgi:hypothetical protein